MDPHEHYADDDKTSSAQHLLSSIDVRYIEPPKRKMSTYLPWITHILYLTIIFSISTFFILRSKSISAMECTRRENTWSPALPAVLPYRSVFFNGTLDYPSPWRGTPSPSLDAAWETIVRMESMEAFSISEEEYLKLGHPLDENVVRLDENQGGGIFAGLEVYHQMHCLNLIRQYTYPEYYRNRSVTFTDPPELLRTHVDHCIEMLRQKLTCDADVGVITHTWVAQRETPWPNFNTLHRCRNWDGVVEWSEKHQAPGVPHMMKRPSDIPGLDPPP
ncbi:MAG: hypothetical protein LQ352_005799 [Teloschistes flavicans]|nr:MAG: hypothetical protein LQ352_005799 [Teloschistes flavicans]